MNPKNNANSKPVLFVFLAIMAAMIILSILFRDKIDEFLNRPFLYPHVLFAHILTVTLFFANAVIGILWELRSLASNRKEIILHTYNTVAWLDARFSSPLIILSVISGIILTQIYGDFLHTGWLFLGFSLFVLSGVIWIISDIPGQYKIKKLLAEVDPESDILSEELMDLLKKRLRVSLAGVVPLIFVFILMVYKPDFTLF
ncbi:DUF2269 family protein [Spirochaeta isovalerica]|uniref:Putative membrane protein n=1 Tax=Spirochaeta isovalerica TaxID=150 RepID=A0A841R4F6_9SPIO|nr:DUF2269 family protein [Spirochaeta isovalerica]MBB6480004.1 putative membrane protein [Spirochaeta isovalerica]